jgi:hypothetical protein
MAGKFSWDLAAVTHKQAHLETDGAPVHELDGPLGLDVGQWPRNFAGS